jgi:hypothetical protein
MGGFLWGLLFSVNRSKTMNIAKKFEQPKAGIKVSSCEEIIFRFSENN